MNDDRDPGPKPCLVSKIVSLVVPALVALAIWGQTCKPVNAEDPPPATVQPKETARVLALRYASTLPVRRFRLRAR